MIELGSRRKDQPAPPWVVWESLVNPHRDPRRPWLELLENEVEPRVLEAEKPSRVVWSSLWPERPNVQIHFQLDPAGYGCSLRWSLMTSSDPPEKGEGELSGLSYRMNTLINANLRYTYGQ